MKGHPDNFQLFLNNNDVLIYRWTSFKKGKDIIAQTKSEENNETGISHFLFLENKPVRRFSRIILIMNVLPFPVHTPFCRRVTGRRSNNLNILRGLHPSELFIEIRIPFFNSLEVFGKIN